MDYSSVVRSIALCPALERSIGKMVERTFALNLVVPDWKNVLDQHQVHKDHTSQTVKYSKGRPCVDDKAHVRSILSPMHCYNVIVAGYFTINVSERGDVSFVVRQCEPLREIGIAMKETNVQTLHDGARLFVEECNPKFCSACLKKHREYNVPIHDRNWCVLKTRLFDGEKVMNVFKSQLEPMLARGGAVMAVMHVQIYNRMTFGNDAYKIGGRVKDLILFQESALTPQDDLDFCLEANVACEMPAVEYPDDDESVVDCIPKDF